MKRLKKIAKWIGIAAGVVIAVLLMFNTYYVWSTGTELEKRLAALRSQGLPVQIADLAHEPIPPETNAETYLRRAAYDLDAIQKELVALYPKRGVPSTLQPADRKKLETLFAAFPRMMPLLEQAATCPDYDPQFDVTLPPSRFFESFMERLGNHRELGRVLKAYSALRISQGRLDDAIAAQLLMLRLTRAWRRNPLCIGFMMTTACKFAAMESVNQALQAGPVSPATRQALDAELALHDSSEGLRWALESERAYSQSAVRDFPGAGFWLTRGFSNHLMLNLLEFYDFQLESASRPYSEAASLKYTSSSRGLMPNPYQGLIRLLDPAMIATRPPAERSRAMVRSLRVLNALQARAGENAPAPDLADLGLPAEATIDPFNGEPLHIKRLSEGWMVYSVGPDGVDDGGNLDGKTDFGFGPLGTDELQK